jgi:hypothetical protein
MLPLMRVRPASTPTLLAEASDGSSSWIYRRFQFTVRRTKIRTWECRAISIPQDVSYPDPSPFEGLPLAIMHEAGFYGRSRAALIRKLCRIVDRRLAEHVRDGVLAGRQPDARTVD